ncbi:variant leucine-rich repeat-containing protein [Nocardiopsis listeri]
MNPPGQRDPASYSAQELADPSIDPTTLRQIAAARPDLWPQIQSHPNCDQELAGHIRRNTPPSAPQPPLPPVRSRRSARRPAVSDLRDSRARRRRAGRPTPVSPTPGSRTPAVSTPAGPRRHHRHPRARSSRPRVPNSSPTVPRTTSPTPSPPPP